MVEREKITKIFISVVLIFKIITPIFILSDRLFVEVKYFNINDLYVQKEKKLIRVSNNFFNQDLKIYNRNLLNKIRKQKIVKIYYTKIYKIPIGLEINGNIYKTKFYNQFNLMFLLGISIFILFLWYPFPKNYKYEVIEGIITKEDVIKEKFQDKMIKIIYFVWSIFFIFLCLIPIIGFFIALF